MFPSNGLITRRPASLPRVPDGTGSPASAVLSGRYDFLPPFPPRFVAFTWRYHPKRSCFARHAAERCRRRCSGVGHPVPPAGKESVETTGSPTFLGNPHCALALLSDPGRTHASGPCDALARPPLCPRRRLPQFVLSRLNHTASALAVYASQAGLPRRHARLASGCWPSSSGRAWLPARFQ
jgi:hypothetical protein